jgi:hypothetical protein
MHIKLTIIKWYKSGIRTCANGMRHPQNGVKKIWLSGVKK